MKVRYDMPFGATLGVEGSAQFRLWAPAAVQPVLAYCNADGVENQLRAEPQAEGFWSCAARDVGAGTRYQWTLDDGRRVPDPAARHNPDGPHGPSQLTDPLAFTWDTDWAGRPWHEVVIYELHVGTFTPEGNFAAAAQRLPALAAIGITAVELMPVAAFGGRFGWGYDAVLPFAPHPAYGTPDELKAFVQTAHRLGMMVFLDVVYNHFGPDGNYLGRYAPQFFSPQHESPWGRALNFDAEGSRAVRDFFIHNAIYWLHEFRIDGLRLDAVHAIVDTTTPDVIDELSARVRATTAGRHVHLMLENDRNQGGRLAATPLSGRFDAQWNDDFHHAFHVLLTGERHGYYADYGDDADESIGLLARALTHGFVFAESARGEGGCRLERAPAPAQPLSAMVNYLNNHDQVGNRAFGERFGALVPAAATDLGLLLTLLTPATPMLFQGDEQAAETPFLYFADWDGALRDAVREGRRREFGHAETPQRPLPDPCSIDALAASRLIWPDEPPSAAQARRALVQAALAARLAWISPRQPELLTGEHDSQRIGAAGLRLRWRYRSGPALVLDVNLGADALPVSTAGSALDGQIVFLHNQDAADPAAMASTWPAWSARWWLQETA